jgi:hypothetical protein
LFVFGRPVERKEGGVKRKREERRGRKRTVERGESRKKERGGERKVSDTECSQKGVSFAREVIGDLINEVLDTNLVIRFNTGEEQDEPPVDEEDMRHKLYVCIFFFLGFWKL